ncbi:cation:proton antiporter [Cesiribacter andamanensis]|uniref:Inner membrane protein ybaL n=1 Tax=Cesiribacter andamanensis AMV16 TaxID=1279009 RepID=M7NRA2_9BACT|nr:cation:proton antiporter [Cesiribacter andamanensis]EMR04235.1 Inner membrane protein ybaL [Cesiribacter andamanensis AMV16]
MESLSHSEIVKLLLQLSIILISGRLMAELARKLKQPAVVGEILAGILLGPTVFGMLAPLQFETLFPPIGASALVFDGFVHIAVILLLFIAGLEVELNLVWQQGRQAVYTSMLGLIIPFILGFIFPFYFPAFFGREPEADPLIFALFVGTAMSITALPVIARILMDMNLFRTRTGMLIVASAMINDLLGWLIFSVIISMIGTGGGEGMSLGTTIALTLGFTILMLTAGKGVINRVLPWINRRFSWPGGLLSLSLGFCFLAAAFTEFIGIHAIFGAFILGVALGDSEHMPERAKEIVHHFVNNVFAPIFFVSIGLKVNFVANFDLMLVLVVLVLAFVGKIVGSGLGTYLGGYSRRESLAIGFGMNARGAMEIILGLIALENKIIDERFFVALVIMALITSITSGPLMRLFLNPPVKIIPPDKDPTLPTRGYM